MFWTTARTQALMLELEGMRQWKDAVKYFSGSLSLADESSSITLDIVDGSARLRDTSEVTEVDIAVTGPASDWRRIAAGELDWFQATTPGFGGLSATGDPVFLMRNVNIPWYVTRALVEAKHAPSAEHFSPPAQPRMAQTVGRYITVDGIETYYEEAGNGPAILCLHAACQDTLMYRHVLAGLSDLYRVIAVDAPGHGKSMMPVGGPFQTLTQHAEFNEKLIETLGLNRPVIIGCSMGGNEVLELAARRPRAYAAVISSEGADYSPGLNSFVLDMMLLNGQQLLEFYSQSLTGHRTPADRAEEVVWQIRRATPEIVRADLGAYSGFDKRDEMHAIVDPVLLIRGNGDWLVSQQQVEDTASRIAGSQIAILDGTGHYPMIENPAEFNQVVRSFLVNLGIGYGA